MAYFLTIAHQQTIADSIHPEIMAAVQHAWTDAQSNDESSLMMITTMMITTMIATLVPKLNLFNSLLLFSTLFLNTFSKELVAFKFYYVVK